VQKAIEVVAIAHGVNMKKAASIYWEQALPLAAVHDGSSSSARKKRGGCDFIFGGKTKMEGCSIFHLLSCLTHSGQTVAEPAPAGPPPPKKPKDMEAGEYKACQRPCKECKQIVDASHWCDICNCNMHGHCGLQMYENDEAPRGPRRCSSCQSFASNESEL
jgi:hypothetical protein